MASIMINNPGPSNITTALYEQAVLQGAVNKRISVFQYLQKAYFPAF
jgi:hypothetical protein